MIRATELSGRAVVDIEAAEKIGTVEKMIFDPDNRRVAGFLVTRAGSGFPGTKAHVLIPAAAVHAIGPDAVTVRQNAVAGHDTANLDQLPKGSDVIGRKVVSEDGRYLGKLSDVLIDSADGRIAGYPLSDHTPGKKWDEVVGSEKSRRHVPYLPADARIRTGRDLIVVAEDAVSYDWDGEADALPVIPSGTPMSKWGYPAPAHRVDDATPNQWVRHSGVDVHPMARDAESNPDGIDSGRETNPRVR